MDSCKHDCGETWEKYNDCGCLIVATKRNYPACKFCAAERNSAEGVERFCKKHGLIRCECPEEMGLSLAELKALEKVADASEKLFSKRDRKQISDRDFDGNLRHRKGSSSVDFLNHWLKLCRPHAYATLDDSWGELEKLLAIILRNYVNVKIFVKPQIKSALDALKQLRGGKEE